MFTGLPLEPYFYWKENLVVLNIELSSDATHEDSSVEDVQLSGHYLCTVLSVFVFCTGVSLVTCLKVATVLFRMILKQLQQQKALY